MRNGLMMIAAFGLAACGGPAAEAPEAPPAKPGRPPKLVKKSERKADETGDRDDGPGTPPEEE